MADLESRTVKGFFGLVASLVLPMAAKGVGWSQPTPIVVFSALLGAFSLWVINVEYRELIEQPDGQTLHQWLRKHLGIAAAGIGFVVLGALLIRLGSADNNEFTVAYALAFLFAGLVPAVQVVRVEVKGIFAESDDKPLTSGAIWGLNALIIGLATLAPALIIATNLRGLVLGAAAAVLWILTEWLGRDRDDKLLSWSQVLLLGTPVLVSRVRDADIELAWWLYLIPIGLGLAVAFARDRKEHHSHAEWHLPLGIMWLSIGVVWYLGIVGGDVSTFLMVAPIVAAGALGVSLVIRGEGLLIVAGLGLLTVWVVQDHTPVGQPEFSTDGDGDGEHIVAFGDSYMSGEGIGTFYQGTNTSGADDYNRGKEDNCRRSPVAYSELVAAHRGANLDFRACSGAKSITNEAALGNATLAEEIDDNTLYGQVLRWESDGLDASEIDLILMSLGGNDAGFSAIGTACFMPGSCDDAIDARREQDLAQVTIRVGVALEKVGETFPSTPIVVIAYPQMFGPDTDACGGQVPFDGGEVAALGSFVEGLNSSVGAAIWAFNETGGTATHFSDGATAFDGSRFCDADENGTLLKHSSMNILNFQPTDGEDLFIRLNPTTLIHNTFHPTEEGHQHVAAALIDFLDKGCHESTSGTGCRQLGAAMTAQVEQGSGSNESCPDIDSYVGCAIARTLRDIALPILAIVLAARFIAIGIDERRWVQNFVGWLRDNGRGPVAALGRAVPVGLDDPASPPSGDGA